MFKEKWQKAVLDHAEAETIQNLKLPILRVELAALRMRMAAAQCVSMPSVSMKPLQPEGRAMGELLSNLQLRQEPIYSGAFGSNRTITYHLLPTIGGKLRSSFMGHLEPCDSASGLIRS